MTQQDEAGPLRCPYCGSDQVVRVSGPLRDGHEAGKTHVLYYVMACDGCKRGFRAEG